MDSLLEIKTGSARRTEELGRAVGEKIERGTIVCLSGELGAGKTVVVRGIARGMGIDGAVTSPTFQLVREYSGRERLFHFDFYRLGSAAEAVDLDIEECLDSGVVAAEWSDRFPGFHFSDSLYLALEWAGENERIIRVTRCAGRGDALRRLLEEKFSSF